MPSLQMTRTKACLDTKIPLLMPGIELETSTLSYCAYYAEKSYPILGAVLKMNYISFLTEPKLQTAFQNYCYFV